ncbi:hypothetical protein [Olsenella profusa]|uniref:Uncharacterized protein n=1 Tax=Olsenella profusa TaxID=138595 RepID=A0ABS2F156_9ACTN|nr:hypothetical protein [Olsenella profusa]MBM6774695.1 hypothetical protein [Olsenella profusa]
MGLPAALIVGGLVGVAGCVPAAVLFERALKRGAKVSVAAGIASVMVSYLALLLALAVAYALAEDVFLAFACSMVALFLLFWAVEAVRAWRAANGGPRA